MPAPELDPATSRRQFPYCVTGFADRRSDAPIDDGRTVALVAQDGAIDRLPMPNRDSLPVFAASLDESNGGRLNPGGPGHRCAQRRYQRQAAVDGIFSPGRRHRQ